MGDEESILEVLREIRDLQRERLKIAEQALAAQARAREGQEQFRKESLAHQAQVVASAERGKGTFRLWSEVAGWTCIAIVSLYVVQLLWMLFVAPWFMRR